MSQENPFRRFLTLGYRRLVSITPPHCEVSPNSSLAQRQKDLGKAPGVRGHDGFWRGYDWLKHQPSEADFDRWAADGAGVGIRLGEGLIAIDIDVLDRDKADTCGTLATKHLGAAENRVGRPPKRLKLYRVAEAVPYQRLKFDGGHVELLSEGRQFVAHGLHPVSGRHYEWPRGTPRFEDLKVVTPAQIASYFEALAKALPAAKHEVSSIAGQTAGVEPVQLAGNVESARKALLALPNDERFDSYDDYIKVAQAIKGALPDDDDLGLDLFQEWASRWTSGSNDPDRVAADWRRCRPSHSLGASYLYSLAAAAGGPGNMVAAEAWFTGEARPDGALEGFEAVAAAEDEANRPEPIAWRRPSEWSGEPPPREWEVKDWIPKGEVVLLYGEGGVGKTLLAHQYAICAATGRDWLGQPTRQAKVMCFFCEDSDDELWRRHIEISKAVGVDPGASDARLRIASRKYGDNLLALWDRNTGAMRRTAVWEQLRNDALLFGADVIIVDTLADTFGGSEIDRSQVNSFVKSCLGRLAAETSSTLIALGHPSVGGRQEGRSGSTAWSNAARARMYLRYPKGRETGNWRELEGMKLNYGPKGAQIRLRWQAGAFTATSARQPEIDLNALKDSSGDVGRVLPSTDSENEAAVLRVLAEAEAEGLPLNLSPRSSAYAPRVLKAAYGQALGMVKAEEVADAIGELMRRGLVRMTTRWSNGNKVAGFAVVASVPAEAAAATWFKAAGDGDGGAFD